MARYVKVKPYRKLLDKRSENKRTRPKARVSRELYQQVGGAVAVDIPSDEGVQRARGENLELPGSREIVGADVGESLVASHVGVRIYGRQIDPVANVPIQDPAALTIAGT